MSYNEGRSRTFKASVDLRTSQYFAVALDTANVGKVVLANAQTVPTIGILHNAPNTGDVAEVILMGSGGTCSAIAGGTVAIGDFVTPDSAGKLIATTTAGDNVVGRAITAATVGQTFEVALLAGFRY